MEDRLRGWKPRQPSRRIERALFDNQTSGRCGGGADDWMARWRAYLNPAAGFAALVAALLCVEMPAGGRVVDPGTATQLAAVTNSDSAAYGQMYHHSVLNHCDYLIFGWTNLSLQPEGIAHFSSVRTPGSTE